MTSVHFGSLFQYKKACTAIAVLGFCAIWAPSAGAQNKHTPAAPAAAESVSAGALSAKELQESHAADRERIRLDRLAVERELHVREKACYQLFAVQDCIQKARNESRTQLKVLRDHEVALNDAERRAKAAERLASIEEKQKAQAEAGATGVQPVLRKDNSAEQHQYNQSQAQQRAAAQKASAEQFQANSAERARITAEKAAQAKQDQAQKLKDAEERRIRVQQKQEDAKARDIKPLPPGN